jgi:GT2 family glycosyltransferase
MLIPKSVIDEVGLLDENFFMYGEDIDWCYRIKSSGKSIWYYGKVNAIHYKGASSGKKDTRLIYEFHRAMWLFYKKHYHRKYGAIISAITWGAVWGRYLLLRFINIFI